MKLSDISIRRPVLASMLSLALVLFGVIGFLKLSVREYPDIDPPIISVSSILPGASPQHLRVEIEVPAPARARRWLRRRSPTSSKRS